MIDPDDGCKMSTFGEAMNTDDPIIIRAQKVYLIESSFRDTADRDYIAARLLHRAELTEQFSWSALQSLEKYLKAILLYHNIATCDLKHNLTKALSRVQSISVLGFSISERAMKFIDYINSQGPDRYSLGIRYTLGNELMDLDHTVWQVRRFCDDFFFPHNEQRLRDHDRARLDFVKSDKAKQNKALFRLDKCGFLEQVLDDKKHPALREILVWKNLYFAGANRRTIRRNVTRHWSQPAHYIYPDVFKWACTRIQIPKIIKEEMKKRLVSPEGPPGSPIRGGRQETKPHH